MLYNIVKVLDSQGNTLEKCPTLKNLVDTATNDDSSVKIFFYDASTGFHPVCNPGWIKFDLGECKKVSYIRIHLWDSCGNGKQQPSHRKYQYRLLYTSSDPFAEDAVWETAYDTMSSGSNGWQEFYKEGENGFGNVQGFMIHLMNNSRNDYTQVVRFQVSEYPTRSIADEFGLDIPDGQEAPAVHRIINNRIICGSPQETALSHEIFKEVRVKLQALETAMSENGGSEDESEKLRILCDETEERINELNGLDTEVKNLTASLIQPVNDEFESQRKYEDRWKAANTISFILAIITLLVDIISGILE